jgi:ethanolamine utilization cobalamin adenosyltransferase
VLGCEVSGKPLADWTLDGMNPHTVHDASHRPQDYGFSGHVLPDAAQGWAAAQCNRLRALCRETELTANVAFADRRGGCTRVDLVTALNRLSSFFYVLQLKTISRH